MSKMPSIRPFDCLKILVGSAVYGLGFSCFAYANAIPAGGMGGLAMIINFLTGIPVGVMTIILNLPLFLIAWRRYGLSFLLSSFAGMLLSSVFVDLFNLTGFVATREVLLSAVYGGVLQGLGLGLVFSAGATTGGSDILAWLLRERFPQLPMGTLMLGMDAVIITAFALLFRRYDSAMYAMILMYISSKFINLLLYGAVNSKVCYIVTDKHAEIARLIMDRLDRGVTFLRGAGAFSGQERDVILCVIKSRQIVELKKLVSEADASAFLIFSDAGEVYGNGFASFDRFP